MISDRGKRSDELFPHFLLKIMDAIKVILGIIFGLIMLGWIATVIVMACGPWVAVVIAAIALTIYLNRD